jgi:hypothetical protein
MADRCHVVLPVDRPDRYEVSGWSVAQTAPSVGWELALVPVLQDELLVVTHRKIQISALIMAAAMIPQTIR